jgi:hypothetical protein
MNDTLPHESSNSKPSLWAVRCFSDKCFISRRRSEWNCQKTHEAIADSGLINCPSASRGLATKHNESFPQSVRIIKPRNYQLPGKRSYLLGQEKAMHRICHSSVFDEEACKLHQLRISGRICFGGRTVTRETRRTVCVVSIQFCMHSMRLLTVLLATFAKVNSVHAGPFHVLRGCALEQPIGNIVNVVIIGR